MTLNVAAEYGGTEAGTVAFALAVEELGYACASTAVEVSVTNMVGEVVQAVGSRSSAGGTCRSSPTAPIRPAPFLTEGGAGSTPPACAARAPRRRRLRDRRRKALHFERRVRRPVRGLGGDRPGGPEGPRASRSSSSSAAPGLLIGKARSARWAARLAHQRGPVRRLPGAGRRLMGRENDGFRVAVGEARRRAHRGRGARSASRAPPWTPPRPTWMSAASSASRSPSSRAVQWMIADREVDLEAARLLILAGRPPQGPPAPFAKAASMAKLFASEAAPRDSDTAIQLHGGAGYSGDYLVERRPATRGSPDLRGHLRDPAAHHRRETLRQVA